MGISDLFCNERDRLYLYLKYSEEGLGELFRILPAQTVEGLFSCLNSQIRQFETDYSPIYQMLLSSWEKRKSKIWSK